MSYKVSSLVLSRKVGGPTKKIILMAMADVANHDGSGVWISNQTVADQSEVSRRTVITQLNNFKDLGWIEAVGKKPCLGGFTTVYNINLDAIKQLEKIGCEISSHVKSDAISSENGRTDLCSEIHTNHPINHNHPIIIQKARPMWIDWKPDEVSIQRCREANFTNQEFEDCVLDFIEYWMTQSNKRNGKKKPDGWQRAFRHNVGATEKRHGTRYRKNGNGKSNYTNTAQQRAEKKSADLDEAFNLALQSPLLR